MRDSAKPVRARFRASQREAVIDEVRLQVQVQAEAADGIREGQQNDMSLEAKLEMLAAAKAAVALVEASPPGEDFELTAPMWLIGNAVYSATCDAIEELERAAGGVFRDPGSMAAARVHRALGRVEVWSETLLATSGAQPAAA